MSSTKLLRQNKHLARALSVNRDIRSLFNRLLLYNLLQTTSVAAVVGNFCYWYIYLDTWTETAQSIIMCEIGKTLANFTLPVDYEMCVRDNTDLPMPPQWTYWFFHLCALISVFGAIIFQCSLKVQERSLKSMKDAVTSLVIAVRMSKDSYTIN